MPRAVAWIIAACMLLGGVLRLWGLAERGLWEVDEATYVLGARAYVHLFEARAAVRARGEDTSDRAAMMAEIDRTFPMDYDFRYRFSRGPARADTLMSGFRTWGKPTYCAAITLATWALGTDTTVPVLAVSALAGTLLIGVLGVVAWRLTRGPWAVAGAAGWAAVSLASVHYSRASYGAMLWVLCAAGILALGFRGWCVAVEETSPAQSAMRGFLVGLLLTIFYGMLPLVGLFLCLEAWWLWRLWRRGGRPWLHVIAIAGACVAPLLLWQVVGLWREHYLHGVLGFENVYSYFGEVRDQMGSEVEISRRSLGSTVRFWAQNLVALEGVPACVLALGGAGVLARRALRGEHPAVAVLGIAVCWLAACTVSRFQLGRIYTPLLPLFGLCLGAALHSLGARSRRAAGAALALVLAYGAWNVRPLLTVRSGLPAAAAWISTRVDPGRVAVCTFGYNQLLRAELDREVANPPTRAVLEAVADVYVDVGSFAARFTPLTQGVPPLAAFPDPVQYYAPARLDLGGVLSPWWRFRVSADDWRRLAGRDRDAPLEELIRIYDVDALVR